MTASQERQLARLNAQCVAGIGKGRQSERHQTLKLAAKLAYGRRRQVPQ